MRRRRRGVRDCGKRRMLFRCTWRPGLVLVSDYDRAVLRSVKFRLEGGQAQRQWVQKAPGCIGASPRPPSSFNRRRRNRQRCDGVSAPFSGLPCGWACHADAAAAARIVRMGGSPTGKRRQVDGLPVHSCWDRFVARGDTKSKLTLGLLMWIVLAIWRAHNLTLWKMYIEL